MTTTTTASDILDAARATIAERGQQRDMPNGERSMSRAVRAFNALYSRGIGLRGGHLSEADGWAFLAILKRARGRDADSLLDGVAYAALEAECCARDAIRNPPEDRG